jgi:hypothetical protein
MVLTIVFHSAAVWFDDSTLPRGWHTEQRSWTRVAPSSAEVEEGVEFVVFDDPDEQAAVNTTKTSSTKRMAVNLIFIITP